MAEFVGIIFIYMAVHAVFVGKASHQHVLFDLYSCKLSYHYLFFTVLLCLTRLSFMYMSQVLSHNLYTALNIPHDPVALEEHFKDNDNGPVSDHGYMPYLNKYILAKVWILL